MGKQVGSHFKTSTFPYYDHCSGMLVFYNWFLASPLLCLVCKIIFLTLFFLFFSIVHLFQGLKALWSHIYVFWGNENAGVLMCFWECCWSCFHSCTRRQLKLALFLQSQSRRIQCSPPHLLNCIRSNFQWSVLYYSFSFLMEISCNIVVEAECLIMTIFCFW